MKRQTRLTRREILQNINIISIIKHCKVILLVATMIVSSTEVLWSQEIKKNIQVDSILTSQEMVAMIQTKVDTEYVYTYEKAKFAPPAGKTLLIMGQTVERITEYMSNFPEQPIPGGWSAYWGVTEFKGVTGPYKNETGSTQNQQLLIDKFPNTVVQSALWMVGMWDVVKKAGKGNYDAVIRQYAASAKTTNRPIYLRIGYEFDGPHNELEPKKYVKAYRRIVDLMRAAGADNIAFVWHSYAHNTYKDYPLSDWYPGDDYVDWVGISVFDQPYYEPGLGPDGDAVLHFAKQHKKPVIICESNPIKGIEAENPDAWKNWFVNFFTIAYNKNIRAISFINEDWTSIHISGTSEWKDARLNNNKKISDAWFLETNKEHYLKQSPELFELLGYKKSN